jgi:hypothetical protein
MSCCSCPTHKAVLLFSQVRYAALARKVVFQLQRFEATGIYGSGHRTLWDEYCHERQNGSYVDELDSAWKATIDPFLNGVVDKVPQHEVVLLTIGAIWNLDEDIEAEADCSAPDLMCRNLEQEVAKVAMARDMSRFDPFDPYGNEQPLDSCCLTSRRTR